MPRSILSLPREFDLVVDLVLIMSVNPGFGGQSFIESQVKKISELRRLCAEKGVNPWIEVDGGVGSSNAYKVIEAGANAIVSGSAVFGAKDYAQGEGFQILRQELKSQGKHVKSLKKKSLWSINLEEVPPVHDGKQDDSQGDDDAPCSLSYFKQSHPPPAFGSSPNLEALALEASKQHVHSGDSVSLDSAHFFTSILCSCYKLSWQIDSYCFLKKSQRGFYQEMWRR